MKDEMIQLYLNNSAAVAREVCLLGAPRCRGIGMVLGALAVSEEQVRDALLEGNGWLDLPYNVQFCSVSDVC
jgi:formin 2